MNRRIYVWFLGFLALGPNNATFATEQSYQGARALSHGLRCYAAGLEAFENNGVEARQIQRDQVDCLLKQSKVKARFGKDDANVRSTLRKAADYLARSANEDSGLESPEFILRGVRLQESLLQYWLNSYPKKDAVYRAIYTDLALFSAQRYAAEYLHRLSQGEGETLSVATTQFMRRMSQAKEQVRLLERQSAVQEETIGKRTKVRSLEHDTAKDLKRLLAQEHRSWQLLQEFVEGSGGDIAISELRQSRIEARDLHRRILYALSNRIGEESIN